VSIVLEGERVRGVLEGWAAEVEVMFDPEGFGLGL